MKQALLISSLVLFSGVALFSQSNVPRGKIPDDLLISLKRSGRFENFTIVIDANGSWKSEGPQGLPLSHPPPKTPLGKPRKVSMSDLLWLASEIERIGLFKFSDGYPVETAAILTSVSDQPTETISVRMNGQIKEVENYLGNSAIRTAVLSNLAYKIRDVALMAPSRATIPDNFAVRFGSSSFGSQTFYSFDSHRLLSYSFYSNMPETSSLSRLFRRPPNKPPKLTIKIPDSRLREIALQIKRSGFARFPTGLLGKASGCQGETVTTHGVSYGISLRLNGQVKQVSMDESCNPIAGTDADAFYLLYRKLEALIAGIKATRLSREQFFIPL